MKTSALLMVLVAVALIALYLVFSKPAYPLTQEDAKRFFLEDLRDKYPDADVREILDITRMAASDGSPYFQLMARVTRGISTPCPERMHVYYDYPPKNFVAQPPEYITKGCKVCLNEPVCIIAYPEEAIIASHTYEGGEKIAQFLKDNSDATASAAFEESYGNHSGVWLVEWKSAPGSAPYIAIVSKAQNSVLEVRETGAS